MSQQKPDTVQKPAINRAVVEERLIREYHRTVPLETALDMAVDKCISDGVPADFLRKNKAKVISVGIFEYDKEKHLETVRREGWNEGHNEGHNEGQEEVGGYWRG